MQKFFIIFLIFGFGIVSLNVYAEENLIPPWIKNTASWWSEDQISESEFLRAIEYLLENDIMKISTQPENSNLPSVLPTYFLPQYGSTAFVEISGTLPEKHEGPLTLTIIQPDNSKEKLTTSSRKGSFMTIMSLTPESFEGNYQVFAEVEGKQIPVFAFNAKSTDSQKVPAWIKNNAGWWAQGLVSDTEFINAITYLIKIGVIIVQTSMQVSSNAFENNAIIPSEYTCDGNDISPNLSFAQIPDGTTTLALIMDDPDAPMGTFVHWVVWNIPPTKTGIEKGEQLSEPQGTTGFGAKEYGGPCPPSGTHRYFFKLFALDTEIDLKAGSKKSDLEKAMKGHIIDQAELIGNYSRK